MSRHTTLVSSLTLLAMGCSPNGVVTLEGDTTPEAGQSYWEADAADVLLYGDATGDEMGSPVRSAGDMDGDGMAELAVGSRGGQGAGAVYIVDPIDSGIMEFAGGNAGIVYGEHSGDELGGFTTTGDINGDGYDDLLMVANGNDDAGEDAGKVYLVPGPIDGANGVDDIAWASWTGWRAGSGTIVVNGASDLDGDGHVDLLLSSRSDTSKGNNTGAVYIVRGPLQPGEHSLRDADVVILGAKQGDFFGGNIAVLGDIDHDGTAEFLASAPSADPGGLEKAGIVYVLPGDLPNGRHQVTDVFEARVYGEAPDDTLGWWLSSSDTDGDGTPEAVMSSLRNDDETGAIYVIPEFTRTNAMVTEAASFVGRGSFAGDRVNPVEGGGDVNGDGRSDLLVGARLKSEDAPGMAYMLTGPLPQGEHLLEDVAHTVFEGSSVSDGFGQPASWAGDVDGDGLDDVAIGARWADHDREDTGVAYLWYAANL